MHRRRLFVQVAVVALGLALPLVRAAGSDDRREEADEQAPHIDRLPRPATLEEYFAIERVDVGADPATQGEEEVTLVGLARHRRLVSADGRHLEWDILFLDDRTRVLHVERSVAGETMLVWRELRPGSGRTLRARWQGEGRALEVREWMGRHSSQLELEAPSGGILPLHLIDLLREGALEGGSVRVFDSLARAFERVSVRVRGGPDLSRRIELVRDDGTLAGRWEFEGADLVAFQWQAGSLRARRIDAQEYARGLEPAEPGSEPEGTPE